ncbi:hypothetical protein BSK62_13240 [Paenibacillus odorifer]|uniref:hypothetical protein n=1 Tax=Paenibacillus odorifer TaxID=189426 RepID=UPI00096C90FE|nr:hypothetical protein [Paenibacillus odorifer]OMD66026.1 hypothetical protein BSK62_13240 [Paenibacillus odorifer]
MYYEFNEPYYALIKGELINHSDAPVELTAVQVYEENIVELVGVTDYMKLRAAKGRHVHEDEALHLFAKCLEGKSFSEAKAMFKEIPNNSLVIVDHALI